MNYKKIGIFLTFILFLGLLFCPPSYSYKCYYKGTARSGAGNIITGATVSLFLAGTTIPAKMYTTLTGTTAVYSTTSSTTDGSFDLYVSRFDYDSDQKFKIVIGKTGYTSVTFDDVDIHSIMLGTYTVSANTTVTTNLSIPKRVIYNINTGVTLTLSGPVKHEGQITGLGNLAIANLFEGNGGTIANSGTIAFTVQPEIGLYQIFTGTGTVSGLNEAHPEWWTANTIPGTTDMTTAFSHAAASVASYSYAPTGTYYTGYAGKVKLSPTVYNLTDTPTGWSGYAQIESDRAVVTQATATKDIFDFSNGFQVSVKGPLILIGGKRQIRMGNNNLELSTLTLDKVYFNSNNTNYALQTYLVAPATNLSMMVTLNDCHFNDVYQVVYNESGSTFRFNNGWVELGYIDLTNRAAFVNKGTMYLNGMYGVPNASLTPTGSRWVDNYGDFYATKSRFGGEGGGYPIVYQYGETRYAHVGGGVVSIENSALDCGNPIVENTIVRLMSGIPSRISIRNNDWITKDSTDFIKIDSSFNIAACLATLAASDQCFIDVANNSSQVPLETIGLPSALINTDKNKVIVNEPFKYYASGLNKTLMHFDGVNASTVMSNEYLSYWATKGKATLSTTAPRFGASALYLPDSTSYLSSTAYASFGGAFTIEFWFHLTDVSTANQVIYKGYNAGGYGVYLYYNSVSDKKLRLSVSSNGTTWDVVSAVAGSYTSWVNGTWYKLTIEFTGSRYSVYEGIAGGTAVTEDIGVTSSSVPCAITTMTIGAPTSSMLGGIDEFRMLLNDYRYGTIFIPEIQKFSVD